MAGDVAYGYAHADATAAILGVARQTQSGWINLVFEVNKGIHIGLEYQYGFLEVTKGTRGDNSRIQMTTTLRWLAVRARATVAGSLIGATSGGRGRRGRAIRCSA